MVSLAVSPTLTVDVYVPGELDAQGSVVLYRGACAAVRQLRGQLQVHTG